MILQTVLVWNVQFPLNVTGAFGRQAAPGEPDSLGSKLLLLLLLLPSSWRWPTRRAVREALRFAFALASSDMNTNGLCGKYANGFGTNLSFLQWIKTVQMWKRCWALNHLQKTKTLEQYFKTVLLRFLTAWGAFSVQLDDLTYIFPSKSPTAWQNHTENPKNRFNCAQTLNNMTSSLFNYSCIKLDFVYSLILSLFPSASDFICQKKTKLFIPWIHNPSAAISDFPVNVKYRHGSSMLHHWVASCFNLHDYLIRPRRIHSFHLQVTDPSPVGSVTLARR